MNLSEIKDKPISELVEIASGFGIEDVGRLKKQDIIFKIFKIMYGFCKDFQMCIYRNLNLTVYSINCM